MIETTQGNLLEADVEAVVNTVNTVGVMGKGIALMFKERFPANYKAYRAACKAGEVGVGRMFVTTSDELSGERAACGVVIARTGAVADENMRAASSAAKAVSAALDYATKP